MWKWIFLVLAAGFSFYFFQSSSTEPSQVTLAQVEPQEVSMVVEGMTCGHCARSITTVLENKFSARDVEVDVESGQVSFVSEMVLEKSKITSSIETLGYEVKSIEIVSLKG